MWLCPSKYLTNQLNLPLQVVPSKIMSYVQLTNWYSTCCSTMDIFNVVLSAVPIRWQNVSHYVFVIAIHDNLICTSVPSLKMPPWRQTASENHGHCDSWLLHLRRTAAGEGIQSAWISIPLEKTTLGLLQENWQIQKTMKILWLDSCLLSETQSVMLHAFWLSLVKV